jgi:very-short-patch-repair endonuclease
MTGPEKRLWAKLRMHQLTGLKFRRQHGIDGYIVDFYCPEQALVIELDGESHTDAEQAAKDQERDDYMRRLGLTVVRYTNDDVMKNLDGVLEDLQQRLRGESTSPNPSLRRRGREPSGFGRGWSRGKKRRKG